MKKIYSLIKFFFYYRGIPEIGEMIVREGTSINNVLRKMMVTAVVEKNLHKILGKFQFFFFFFFADYCSRRFMC